MLNFVRKLCRKSGDESNKIFAQHFVNDQSEKSIFENSVLIYSGVLFCSYHCHVSISSASRIVRTVGVVAKNATGFSQL